MADPHSHIGLVKAVLWEEAKGKLRAMVAAEGQVSPHDPADEARRRRWPKAQADIEAFIAEFEADGLHE